MDLFDTLVLGSLLITVLIFTAIVLLPGYLEQQARAALQRGDYPGAMKYTDWMGTLRVRAVDAILLRAVALLEAGHLHQAEAFLQQSEQLNKPMMAIDRDHYRFNIRVLQALAYREQGRYDEALHAYEEARARAPKPWLASVPILGSATTYLLQGDQPAQALELLDQLLDQEHPPAAEELVALVLVNRVWALLLLERASEARDDLEQALRSVSATDKPRSAELYYRVGQVMLLQDDPTSAHAYFTRALQSDPLGLYGQRATEALNALDMDDQASTV